MKSKRLTTDRWMMHRMKKDSNAKEPTADGDAAASLNQKFVVSR
jgi:hypothetical protein